VTVYVRFIFDEQQMSPSTIRKWLERGDSLPEGWSPLMDGLLQLFLDAYDHTYGFLQFREFKEHFLHFCCRLVCQPRDDWSEGPRAAKRCWNYVRALMDHRVDFKGEPSNDDSYLHPRDLKTLNSNSGLLLEHISMAEMFDVYDVVVVGETHKLYTASKYLHLCHAFYQSRCESNGDKYEIRVLLDGLGQKHDNEPLSCLEVARNFPIIANLNQQQLYSPKIKWKLCNEYQFFGLEPNETEMFTRCQGISKLDTPNSKAAAEWFFTRLREDAEFVRIAKLHDTMYEDLIKDAETFSKNFELTFEMKGRIKAAADIIEFAERSAIRMDANIAWGRTIQAVFSKPAKGDLPVKVLVLCGTNHTLCRSQFAVPVQGAIPGQLRVQTLVFANDDKQVMEYRKVDDSENYVFTIPHTLIDDAVLSFGL
jgi:hypothetical protein